MELGGLQLNKPQNPHTRCPPRPILSVKKIENDKYSHFSKKIDEIVLFWLLGDFAKIDEIVLYEIVLFTCIRFFFKIHRNQELY